MIKISSNQILASKCWDSKVYIEIAKSIAEHGTRLLWGQGFEYTDTNEARKKAVQQMFYENNVQDLFKTISNTMSLYGRCIVVIDFIGNKPKLNIVDMNMQLKVGMAWANETGAVYWYRPIQDNLNFVVKVVSNKKFNKYTAYGNGKEISIDELNENLPPEQQIPEVWVHNLGFVPVVQMLNKDFYVRNINQFEYLQMADCYNVRDMLEAVNDQINLLIEEAETNKTRVFGSFSPQQLNEMIKNKITPESTLTNRLFINQGAVDGKQSVVVQQSTFDGETRWAVIDKMLNRIMYESGYSPIEDQTITTATEALFQKARDIETTKQKRNRMQFYISQLLKKCFVIMGFYTKEQYEESSIYGDDTWTFEIKENMILSPVAMSEQLATMYERDQISYVEMIAKLRDISVEEAETIAQEIMKQNNEIKAQQLATMTEATTPKEQQGEESVNEAKDNQDKKRTEQETE